MIHLHITLTFPMAFINTDYSISLIKTSANVADGWRTSPVVTSKYVSEWYLQFQESLLLLETLLQE